MRRPIVSHPPILLWVLLLLSLLSGCAGTPGSRGTTQAPLPASDAAVKQLLAEAAQAKGALHHNLSLQAAELVIQQSQGNVSPRALNLLLDIDAEQLNDRNFAVYTRWLGLWSLDHQQQDLAQRLLDSPKLGQLMPRLDEAEAVPLHELRIRYFRQSEQALRAVDEYMALGPLLIDPVQQQQQRAALWALLQQLSAADQDTLQQSSHKQLRGWIDLLRIATAQELDLDEQITELDQWLANNSRHPAASDLPAELRLLQNATRERPRHLTLLLPLSGPLQKAGEAVRDGFLAAYYQAMQRGYDVPLVDIVNSHAAGLDEFLRTYDRLPDSNTQLVIGPLEKEYVALLKTKNRVALPTLALNDSGDGVNSQTTGNLFLFGLNPEDEARQVARQTRTTYQRALVIAPNNDWGIRINNAFVRYWLTGGEQPATSPADTHKILGSTLFDSKKDDYSTVLQRALGIEDSQNRYRRIRQWFSDEVEFEPRRRQDLDMIFLAARPEQARQINPLLAFHYAGDVPVYASASVYSGETLSEKDNDLNGIQLLVSPWLLNSNTLRQTLDSQQQAAPGLQNLYAMGADAWRLHARLTLLANSPQGRLYGNTGLLQMESGQRITRQQPWARIKQGRLQALTLLTNE